MYTQQAETTIPGTEGVVRARRRYRVEAVGLYIIETVSAAAVGNRFTRLCAAQIDRHAADGRPQRPGGRAAGMRSTGASGGSARRARGGAPDEAARGRPDAARAGGGGPAAVGT